MMHFADTLKEAARLLRPHRDALLESWIQAVEDLEAVPEHELRPFCTAELDRLLERLESGEVESMLAAEAEAASQAVRRGSSFRPAALTIRVLDRCCLPHLLAGDLDRERLAEMLLALDELADRRLEILLQAQEEETARRLVEAQEQAASAQDRAQELARANAALSSAETRAEHRADQIALLVRVARRIAGVLHPEALLQETAEVIHAQTHIRYAAVVVLDEEGVVVGRWSGTPGVDRHGSGRAQGPPAGIIGRAIRKRAPQVVRDVAADPDYHADVEGTRSEMVIPLIEEGRVVGAIDFQSDQPEAFDLDDVVAGEAIADFVVIALRNARMFDEVRRGEDG